MLVGCGTRGGLFGVGGPLGRNGVVKATNRGEVEDGKVVSCILRDRCDHHWVRAYGLQVLEMPPEVLLEYHEYLVPIAPAIVGDLW